MTDIPPPDAPVAPLDPFAPFDPDVEFEAQLIERYGEQAPVVGYANHVQGTLAAHDRTLDQHGRHLERIDGWADGVNAFGQFQMELNGTMTQAVAHQGNRTTAIERHLSNTQVVELIAAVCLGIGSVVFALWVGSHDSIGGVQVSQTLAVWIAWALALAWIVIVAVMLIGWFRPHQDEEPAQNQQAPAPPADRAPAPPPPAA